MPLAIIAKDISKPPGRRVERMPQESQVPGCQTGGFRCRNDSQLLHENRDNQGAGVIVGGIALPAPQLAGEIKRLMFLFEDLLFVDDKGIQRILREVDKKDLAMSMKVSEDKLKQKIFSNMSERAQELLKEELQYMGPVRLKDVEMAQTRIVEIVKQLEDQGEIVVAGRGGKEEVFV